MKWIRCKTTSDYEPIILTPEQAFRLVENFPQLERTLTLLDGGNRASHQRVPQVFSGRIWILRISRLM